MRTVLPTFVTDGNRCLVQLPADNEWGFVLADDDQTWPGGIGSGMDSWVAVPSAYVPDEDFVRLGFLLEQ